jgi:hypothetical protein
MIVKQTQVGKLDAIFKFKQPEISVIGTQIVVCRTLGFREHIFCNESSRYNFENIAVFYSHPGA